MNRRKNFTNRRKNFFFRRFNELESAFCFRSSAKPEAECMKKPFFQGFRPKERQVVFVFCRKAVD